jgi:DNA-binding IclR family transcriptional regulator
LKNEKYIVPAIENAVSVLQYLSKEENIKGKNLSEISDSTNLNRSTCFRILQSLQKYNFISHNAINKTYKLGHYLTFLGSKASETSFDIQIMKPYLEKASHITNQTCIISQRFSDNQIIYIAKQESNSDLRINVSVGQQRPITNTAMGKCFLAYLSKDEVEHIIKSIGGIKEYTPYTIVEHKEFMKNLEVIKERGYSISKEEWALGISGVAAPIFDSNHQVCFVLSLSCLQAQVTDEKLHFYGSALKEIAEQITHESLKYYESTPMF